MSNRSSHGKAYPNSNEMLGLGLPGWLIKNFKDFSNNMINDQNIIDAATEELSQIREQVNALVKRAQTLSRLLIAITPQNEPQRMCRGGGMVDQIISYIRTRQDGATVSDIFSALPMCQPGSIRTTLAKLVTQHQLVRVARGVYTVKDVKNDQGL